MTLDEAVETSVPTACNISFLSYPHSNYLNNFCFRPSSLLSKRVVQSLWTTSFNSFTQWCDQRWISFHNIKTIFKQKRNTKWRNYQINNTIKRTIKLSDLKEYEMYGKRRINIWIMRVKRLIRRRVIFSKAFITALRLQDVEIESSP